MTSLHPQRLYYIIAIAMTLRLSLGLCGAVLCKTEDGLTRSD